MVKHLVTVVDDSLYAIRHVCENLPVFVLYVFFIGLAFITLPTTIKAAQAANHNTAAIVLKPNHRIKTPKTLSKNVVSEFKQLPKNNATAQPSKNIINYETEDHINNSDTIINTDVRSISVPNVTMPLSIETRQLTLLSLNELQLYQQYKGLMEQGRLLQTEGRSNIISGRAMIANGSKLVADGQNQIAEGVNMVEQAQRALQINLPQLTH